MEHRFLSDRFPEWHAEIEDLCREGAAFREICQDYEAVLGTLAQLQQSAAAEARLLHDCQTLLRDLTKEALQVLQQHFPYLDTSDTKGRRG